MSKSGAAASGKEWIIEPRAFSERREVFERSLSPEQLERLAAEAAGPLEPVRVKVRGLRSPRGHAGIALEARGRIRVVCQRCMQGLDLELAPQARFEWAQSEAALEGDDDDDWDLLPPSTHFDLLPLIEDELLLALPYAPMHDVCSPAGSLSAGEKVSPFAALASLKSGPERGGS